MKTTCHISGATTINVVRLLPSGAISEAEEIAPEWSIARKNQTKFFKIKRFRKAASQIEGRMIPLKIVGRKSAQTIEDKSVDPRAFELEWLEKAAKENVMIDQKLSITNELLRLTRRVVAELEAYENMLQNRTISADTIGETHEKIERYESDIAGLVVKIYDRFCAMHLFSPAKDLQNDLEGFDQDPPDHSTEGKPLLNVSGYINNNLIIIKTPRLLSRNMSRYKVDPTHSMYRSMHLFKNEVAAFLESQKENVPVFGQKNITIVSVYSPDSAQQMVDNDNLECKGIVDAIASFTGGDSALNCSFFQLSLVTPDASPGTYFVVTPEYDQPPARDFFLDILPLHFPKSLISEPLQKVEIAAKVSRKRRKSE